MTRLSPVGRLWNGELGTANECRLGWVVLRKEVSGSRCSGLCLELPVLRFGRVGAVVGFVLVLLVRQKK